MPLMPLNMCRAARLAAHGSSFWQATCSGHQHTCAPAHARAHNVVKAEPMRGKGRACFKHKHKAAVDAT